MKNLVGVQFQRATKLFDYDAGGLLFSFRDKVIVESQRGLELAEVMKPPRPVQDGEAPKTLPRVIRKATAADLDRAKKNVERQVSAKHLCQHEIRQRNLGMRLIDVHFSFDASKTTFYFTAEERVDFRELVKDLAQKLHTRIDMRQIGVRDEAKMVGGVGPCGEECCCSRFLREFTPVSIKMAKDQGVAVNPEKVSGKCGRLMCCLAYEVDTYNELAKDLPRRGATVETDDGTGKVVGQNILKQEVMVALDGQNRTVKCAGCSCKASS